MEALMARLIQTQQALRVPKATAQLVDTGERKRQAAVVIPIHGIHGVREIPSRSNHYVGQRWEENPITAADVKTQSFAVHSLGTAVRGIRLGD